MWCVCVCVCVRACVCVCIHTGSTQQGVAGPDTEPEVVCMLSDSPSPSPPRPSHNTTQTITTEHTQLATHDALPGSAQATAGALPSHTAQLHTQGGVRGEDADMEASLGVPSPGEHVTVPAKDQGTATWQPRSGSQGRASASLTLQPGLASVGHGSASLQPWPASLQHGSKGSARQTGSAAQQGVSQGVVRASGGTHGTASAGRPSRASGGGSAAAPEASLSLGGFLGFGGAPAALTGSTGAHTSRAQRASGQSSGPDFAHAAAGATDVQCTPPLILAAQPHAAAPHTSTAAHNPTHPPTNRASGSAHANTSAPAAHMRGSGSVQQGAEPTTHHRDSGQVSGHVCGVGREAGGRVSGGSVRVSGRGSGRGSGSRHSSGQGSVGLSALMESSDSEGEQGRQHRPHTATHTAAATEHPHRPTHTAPTTAPPGLDTSAQTAYQGGSVARVPTRASGCAQTVAAYGYGEGINCVGAGMASGGGGGDRGSGGRVMPGVGPVGVGVGVCSTPLITGGAGEPHGYMATQAGQQTPGTTGANKRRNFGLSDLLAGPPQPRSTPMQPAHTPSHTPAHSPMPGLAAGDAMQQEHYGMRPVPESQGNRTQHRHTGQGMAGTCNDGLGEVRGHGGDAMQQGVPGYAPHTGYSGPQRLGTDTAAQQRHTPAARAAPSMTPMQLLQGGPAVTHTPGPRSQGAHTQHHQHNGQYNPQQHGNINHVIASRDGTPVRQGTPATPGMQGAQMFDLLRSSAPPATSPIADSGGSAVAAMRTQRTATASFLAAAQPPQPAAGAAGSAGAAAAGGEVWWACEGRHLASSLVGQKGRRATRLSSSGVLGDVLKGATAVLDARSQVVTDRYRNGHPQQPPGTCVCVCVCVYVCACLFVHKSSATAC